MKKIALVTVLLMGVASAAMAQGGSGAPSPAGQSITPAGEASADAAVARKHQKRVAKKAAKAQKKDMAASS